jgi:N-carbamoylputrescine amidase
MKVTVCELTNDPRAFPAEWEALAAHVRESASDLVLLPEMPFHRWLPAIKEVDSGRWEESIRSHDAWWARLPELEAHIIVTTRPVIDEGRRFQEGVAWLRDGEATLPAHRKSYLPDEEGFWEATWYSRGAADFTPIDLPGARAGFLICTELWFTRHARDLGKEGVQILLSPRATQAATIEKWLLAGRAAAIVAGAYSLSSNFSGPFPGSAGEPDSWGGTGWIVEPESGEVLGTTSREAPFLTMDIDLAVADCAKSTYPRYVAE